MCEVDRRVAFLISYLIICIQGSPEVNIHNLYNIYHDKDNNVIILCNYHDKRGDYIKIHKRNNIVNIHSICKCTADQGQS